MAWRVAASLNVLLTQIDNAYPRRSKRSDGSIGDAAHATRTSDHNPWYVIKGVGVVTARDFTHDPGAGFDSYAFAERLRQARDPRIKYVISNRRIFSSYDARNSSGVVFRRAWTWGTYSGSNPHDKHVHVSVVADPRCDDSRPWAGVTASTAGSRIPDLSTPEDDMTPEQSQQLAFVAERVKYLDTKSSDIDEHVKNALKVKNPVTGQQVDINTAMWSTWHYAYHAYLAANPEKLAAAVAAQLPKGAASSADVQAAVEKGIRNVLGSLNDPKES